MTQARKRRIMDSYTGTKRGLAERMTNPDFPTQPQPIPPRTRSNCFVVGGITCLVLVVIIAGLTIWGIILASRNPQIKKAVSSAQLRAACQLHMSNPSTGQDIYDALERYRTRYGQYPAKLADLYPTFLEDRSVLHCPADTRAKDVVSYDYYPPAANAPGSTVIVECKRHIILEGQPPLALQLTKDGQVLSQGFTPHSGPVEQPKSGD